MLGLIEKDDTRLSGTEEGDHDKFAHYVPKDDYMAALVFGTPAKALCGKQWVPTRDGEKFPPCPDCAHIYNTDHLILQH